MKPDKNLITILMVGAVAFLAASWAIKDMEPLVDERIHFMQTAKIVYPHIELGDRATQIPGYHWTMAGLLWLTRCNEGPQLRFMSTAISFLTVIAFFFLAKAIDEKSALEKSLHFLFLPILFPYFFILYTDAYSLLWIFLSVHAALKRRYTLSGVFNLFSILVRQNNIFWSFFLCGLIYVENSYTGSRNEKLKRWAKDCWAFTFGLIAIVIFLIVNKGPVLGDKSRHHLTIDSGNVFLGLFLFFFLFLPFNLSLIRNVYQELKKNRNYLIWGTALFLVYLVIFRISHFYNDPRIFRFFLRNRLLGFMTENLIWKIICFLPIAYAIVSIKITPLLRKSFYLLYPVSFLFLLPGNLIEHRYCFIPYSLFLLFREKHSWKVTLATLLIYLVFSVYFIWGMTTNRFFL